MKSKGRFVWKKSEQRSSYEVFKTNIPGQNNFHWKDAEGFR